MARPLEIYEDFGILNFTFKILGAFLKRLSIAKILVVSVNLYETIVFFVFVLSLAKESIASWTSIYNYYRTISLIHVG